MVSISRAVLVVGILLLVGGVVSGGWGVYQQSTDTCKFGYGVMITRLAGNETASKTAEHVTYSNLPVAEQQKFREILKAKKTPIYQNSTQLESLTQKVVTYQAERYETGPLFVSDCGDG